MPYSIDKQVDARAGADRDGFRALVWARASSYARRVAADHAAFASTL